MSGSRGWNYELRAEADSSSAYVKSSHEFLPRFHGELRIHAAEDLLTAFRVHGCQLAHQFVARLPFCVFAPANAGREKR
jgi:hypothetical protein